MSRDQRNRELMVGSFAALALVTVALGILAVGSGSALFSRTAEYHAGFPSTDGLRQGAPVKLSGVQIGVVHRIDLPVDPAAAGIDVVMRVRDEHATRLRQDAKAALRFLQIVSGEKYVEIFPGSPSLPALPPGSTIPPLDEQGLLDQGEDIAANLAKITASVSRLLEPLERGEGLLGEMLQDPEFGKEGLAALRTALENIAALTADLRAREGLAGRLISDPALAGIGDDLAIAARGLAGFASELDGQRAAIAEIVGSDGDLRRALASLNATAAALERTAARLERSRGLLGRLLNDEEWSEGLAGDLREIAARGASIARKIDEGQGTLGLLVNDRTLYDGATQVVAGVGDSKFANWLARRYQKRGIEAQEAGSAAAPGAGTP